MGTRGHSDCPAAAFWELYTTNTQCQSQTAGLRHSAGIPPHTLTEKQTNRRHTLLICRSIRASQTEQRKRREEHRIRLLSLKCSQGVKVNSVLSAYPLSVFISCGNRLVSLPLGEGADNKAIQISQPKPLISQVA